MNQPHDYLKIVESLERIYQIVVALAMTEAVKRFIRDPVQATSSSGEAVDKTDMYFHPHWDSLPEAFAFFATAVPFFHGMNRHLEKTYGAASALNGLLLLDIFVFLFEGSIMFMLASSLTAKNLRFFKIMIFLLGFDSLWCLISYACGGSSATLQWLYQNVVLIALLAVLIKLRPGKGATTKWLCMVMVIGKTVWDYYWNWSSFYFAP